MEQIYRTYELNPEVTGSLIPLADVKNYVGIDVVGDDDMVERLVKTAFDSILLEFDIVTITSDVVENIENPNRNTTLKFKPNVSGSISVVKVNDDNTTESLEWRVVRGQYTAKVEIKEDLLPDQIRIDYKAGFGTDETNIVDPLYNIVRQGVLQSVGTLYEDRENNVMGSMVEIPSSTRNLIENTLNSNRIY